jgi:putative flippase GtrA
MTTFESLCVRCRDIRDRMTHAALPAQFLGYLIVGAVCALINVLLFSIFFRLTATWLAATAAFVAAAAINYWLCVTFLFTRSGWSTWQELTAYAGLVAVVANIDALSTTRFIAFGARPVVAKISATFIAFVFNFLGRRFLIFSESRKTNEL